MATSGPTDRALLLKGANMPKSTKTTTKKRTQVKDLPKSKQKLNKKEMSKVKGGLVHDLGPDNVQKKQIAS